MILYLMRVFSILKYAPVFLLFRKVKYHTPRTHKQTDNEEALIFSPKGPNTGTEAAAAFVACLSFFFFTFFFAAKHGPKAAAGDWVSGLMLGPLRAIILSLLKSNGTNLSLFSIVCMGQS